jgi:L-amino acid N-acyltransferase YncA
MQITIREATTKDAPQMAELLNEIIEIGGTTAFLQQVSADQITHWIIKDSGTASWHVAVNDTGHILGQQSAEPHEKLPPEAADIASYVRIGATGLRIGTQLFESTSVKAQALGYVWLNASIRSDNDSGLRYYAKMGFKDWKVEPDARLSDGRITGKHHKRYDL